VNSVTTEILYLHDGMNAIVERNKTGTPTEYIYGPTGIIAIKTPSSMHYVLKDHLGSTRVMINTTDLPYALTTYDYSAFGTILTPPPSSGYLYTGQEWDQTSGLHNFKARMYDSDLMRFYGVDAAEQFSSPFTYASNNPLIYRDPDGEFIWAPVIIGAVLGGYFGGTQAHMQGRNVWKGIAFGAIGGAAGGAVGGAIGPVGGLVQNIGVGALSSGVSGAVSTGLSGGNVASAFKSNAIAGGITSGALYTIGYLNARFQSNDGQSTSIDWSKNETEGYEEYIDESMNQLAENGGDLGKRQHMQIIQNKTKIAVNNSLSGYGAAAWKGNSIADEIAHFVWNGGAGDSYILLNHDRLQNPPAEDVPHWKSLKLGGPENLVGRTVQSLYHESGHLYGLYQYNGDRTFARYHTPASLRHLGPHRFYSQKIGNLTLEWLKTEFVSNYIR
jgi:RHS repeat-associated protein